MIKRIIIILIILNFNINAKASIKDEIIFSFKKIENISFNFKQTIDEKIEEGNCIIKYQKKSFAAMIILKEKL